MPLNAKYAQLGNIVRARLPNLEKLRPALMATYVPKDSESSLSTQRMPVGRDITVLTQSNTNACLVPTTQSWQPQVSATASRSLKATTLRRQGRALTKKTCAIKGIIAQLAPHQAP